MRRTLLLAALVTAVPLASAAPAVAAQPDRVACLQHLTHDYPNWRAKSDQASGGMGQVTWKFTRFDNVVTNPDSQFYDFCR